MSEKKIKDRVLRYRQQIISTLCDLIAIPTPNPPGQPYRECVTYFSELLSD